MAPVLASLEPQAAARQAPSKERTPRVDQAGQLRRTFAVDVFALRVGAADERRAAGEGAGLEEDSLNMGLGGGARGWHDGRHARRAHAAHE